MCTAARGTLERISPGYVMHRAAVAQLHNDAQWLGSHNIMDYSLLIGLPHHPVPIHRPPFPIHPLRRCWRVGVLRINRHSVALRRRAAPLLRDRESTRAAECRVGTAFALAAPADALIDLCAPSCADAALTATRLLGQAAPAGGVGPGWPVLDRVSFACPGQGHALVLQVGLAPTGRRRPALCGRVGCFDQGECAERLSQRLLVREIGRAIELGEVIHTRHRRRPQLLPSHPHVSGRALPRMATPFARTARCCTYRNSRCKARICFAPARTYACRALQQLCAAPKPVALSELAIVPRIGMVGI
jgi:hypothetical protein